MTTWGVVCADVPQKVCGFRISWPTHSLMCTYAATLGVILAVSLARCVHPISQPICSLMNTITLVHAQVCPGRSATTMMHVHVPTQQQDNDVWVQPWPLW